MGKLWRLAITPIMGLPSSQARERISSAMKQEVLDIMRDRKTFGDVVEDEVNGALKEWGLELVKLEIVNFSDSGESLVLRNYEKARESEIHSESRKKIALQNKEAEVEEAKNAQEAGIAKANSEREVEKANVEKTKQVSISQQEADLEVAKKQELANAQKVSAQRKTVVGEAQVQKEAKIELAQGEAEATKKVGQAEADVTDAKGTAEANVVKGSIWYRCY